jgi:uncharacterized protein YutE (UPF0331/DUF86 family)
VTASERLARKAAAIERHLRRVESLRPPEGEPLLPETEACDGIVLHLWQAVQSCIDLAVARCAELGLGPVDDYASAFRALAGIGMVEPELAERLVRAVGFRNVVSHDYENLDLDRVRSASETGPADLRAFLAALARSAGGS